MLWYLIHPASSLFCNLTLTSLECTPPNAFLVWWGAMLYMESQAIQIILFRIFRNVSMSRDIFVQNTSNMQITYMCVFSPPWQLWNQQCFSIRQMCRCLFPETMNMRVCAIMIRGIGSGPQNEVIPYVVCLVVYIACVHVQMCMFSSLCWLYPDLGTLPTLYSLGSRVGLHGQSSFLVR